ncbi:hypothetical protein BIU82_11390 [Arthrobacter sp. SW1]|uniref:hypothetical protein n=1 Tax=Arthrobacter sp. SW1 TaxID=1920889 RepID=UPI000877DBD6|nr:hypothetical protein [Arthrobacter sp. SW1]OFI37008.1 hypothetical protein BIU82_11390 [Arthrobacter sp. SW1]
MSLFTVLGTSKVAAGILAAGALTVGGSGAAAFAGALPANLQQKAHELVGAPAPSLPEVAVPDVAAPDVPAEADAAKTEALGAVEGAKAEAQGAVEGAKAKAAEAKEALEAKIADAVADAKEKAADVTLPESFGLCKALLSDGLSAEAKVAGYESLAVTLGGEGKVEAHCEQLVADVETELNGSASASADAGADAAVPAVPAVPAGPELPAVPAVPAVPAAPAELPAAVDGLLDSVRP